MYVPRDDALFDAGTYIVLLHVYFESTLIRACFELDKTRYVFSKQAFPKVAEFTVFYVRHFDV